VFTTQNTLIVAILQVGVVVMGTLWLAVIERVHWHEAPQIPQLLNLVQHSWFLLLLVPIIWTTVAIRVLHRPRIPDGKKSATFWSGILLLLLLVVLMLAATMNGLQPPQAQEGHL